MDSFIIIGTAGHVDHGKTELVRALTGVDTDRLKEEKERGISIELGFAPLRFAEGVTAGIVDVPGHERFVKNMLAGAGGIDLVIFVVAADEGVMPQTREHLDILELLHIQKAVVAITKADLVEEEWMLMVEEDVQELLAPTRFSTAPIIPTSVITGEGLDELRTVLEKMAMEVDPKPRIGEARLPVDRVFTITGFGTVVTGTLFSGHLHTGDTLEIQPSGLKGRVRSLQVHSQKVEEALAGQRVAVNLTGIELDEVSRGDVLVTPGAFPVVRRVTASLYLLERASRPLKNWQRIRFHLGTKEALGRVRLLDRDELHPGETAPAQLELEEPIVAAVHDRFVIRYYSPVTTIGGGEIIEVGGRRHRRFRDDVLAGLERKLTGTPTTRVAEELRSARMPVAMTELASRTGFREEDMRQILKELEESGDVQIVLSYGKDLFVVPTPLYEEWVYQAKETLKKYHQKYPLREGYPKEELRTRLWKFLTPRLYQALLDRWAEQGEIIADGQNLTLPEHQIRLTGEQEQLVQEMYRIMAEQPFSPPGAGEIQEMLGDNLDLLQYCIQQGMLVKVSEEFYFLQDAVNQAWDILEKHLKGHGEMTIGQARDMLGTSRRFCLPLLEYFDRQRKTRRVGDKRVLLSGPGKRPT
ncbi:MAG TPA: selenocysteine-specific translation elongation factor [Syntrophomonadaceae bacterium]|nr:selenocysteine-specific translation elongation factor [Syntrophomonadaceae bacterium]